MTQEVIDWIIFFIIIIFGTLTFMIMAIMIVDTIINKEDK